MCDVIRHRLATVGDSEMLGGLNHRLIHDEGHRNPMSVDELSGRMRQWLQGEYQAVIFELASGILGYCLIREEDAFIYIRQFYIRPELRGRGFGRKCMEILLSDILPKTKRITVEVLIQNDAGVSFWRSLGFADYSLSLELHPKSLGGLDACASHL